MTYIEHPKSLQLMQQTGFESIERETMLPPYPALEASLDEQEKQFGTRNIVFADINKTTEVATTGRDIPNKPLYETLQENYLPLVHITSLSLREVVELINKGIIQTPHALGLKAGTLGYGTKPDALLKPTQEVTEGDFIEDTHYREVIQATGFDKAALLQQTKEHFMPLVREQLFPGIQIDLQKEDKDDNPQGLLEDPHQIVCDVLIPQDMHEATHEALLAFTQQYHPDKYVFIMNNGMKEKHRFYGLFVLPQGFGKHYPLQRIMDRMNATGGMFFGDSENDAAAIFNHYGQLNRKVLRAAVGGLAPELAKHINSEAVENPNLGGNWKEIKTGDNGSALLYQETNPKLVGPASFRKALIQTITIRKHYQDEQKYAELFTVQ